MGNEVTVTLSGLQQFENSFWAMLNAGYTAYQNYSFMESLGNLGHEVAEFDHKYGVTKSGRFLESTGRVIVGANPVISVIDGAMVLSTGQNMYGEEANTAVDKGFAVLGIVFAFQPGENLLKNTTGEIIDKASDISQAIHNSGTLNSLKE